MYQQIIYITNMLESIMVKPKQFIKNIYWFNKHSKVKFRTATSIAQ
jgi:hypothetical protein